jgi:transcriptional regulator with PAS, ATPase and Fis domain
VPIRAGQRESDVTETVEHQVAVLSENAALQSRLVAALTPGIRWLVVPSARELLVRLKTDDIAAVVLNLESENGSPEHAVSVVRSLRAASGDTVLIVLARLRRGFGARIKAAGADEVLPWNIDPKEVENAVQHGLAVHQAEIEQSQMKEQTVSTYCFGELVGGSEPMRKVYEAVSRVAAFNTTVLIRGESGTGKELVARAILASSPRWDKPFVSVNCAAFPETLIEAELFGYEKGAFTGAYHDHAGHFEAAHGGTVFLDEIGSLGLALQGKLLRVLEDRSVQRIGGKKAQRIDFRLITASNQDLEEMVRVGRFREDLFYRIHVVPIFLPPLRERTGDIPLLVDYFVRLYCTANTIPMKRVDPDVVEVLEDYTWPGNVRELENLIQRLVLMAEGEVIRVKHLPQQLLYHSTAQQEALLIPDEGITFDEEIARIEAAYLNAALRRTQGRKSAAAALLHISPQKMKYLCRKYDI